MKIYCNYCNTPTHADTSCPYQLKEEIMSQCSKCKNLILEPHTTYGINPLAVCRCATMTTPEDTELREKPIKEKNMSNTRTVGELVGQASMLFYNEETKLLDGVFDEKQAQEIVDKIEALIDLHTQKAELKESIGQLNWFRENVRSLHIDNDINILIGQYKKQLDQLTNPTERKE